jgi:hypothetical protein
MAGRKFGRDVPRLNQVQCGGPATAEYEYADAAANSALSVETLLSNQPYTPSSNSGREQRFR